MARLLIFSGSAFGAGKSRLSTAIATALSERGHRVRALSEDDLLADDGFARFEQNLGPTDPELHRADRALVEAARALVEQTLTIERHVAPGTRLAVTTDALLPGFFWLFGRHDRARVRLVADELAGILAPLDPLLVYLRGDPGALVARAAAQRGAHWPAMMATRVARWNIPHYPGAPVRTLGDVLRFWSWLDDETVALLGEWAVGSLVLDATQPFASLVDAVLADPRVSAGP